MEYYSPMKNEIYSKVDDIGDHHIKRNRPQRYILQVLHMEVKNKTKIRVNLE